MYVIERQPGNKPKLQSNMLNILSSAGQRPEIAIIKCFSVAYSNCKILLEVTKCPIKRLIINESF